LDCDVWANSRQKSHRILRELAKRFAKEDFEKLASAKENPEHFFERLEGRKDYKLRAGDYRVIADINRNLKRIEVTLIDHRKKAYKKLLKER